MTNRPFLPPPQGPPLREDITPERWFPTPREHNYAILKVKKNKAADAGAWTAETAQSCLDHPHLKETVLNWTHAHAVATEGPARRRGLRRTHRLVISVSGQRRGGHQTNLDWHALVQGSQPPFTPTSQVRLGNLLQDRQFGIGTPQGGLAMTTALKAHLAEHPESSPITLPTKPSLAGCCQCLASAAGAGHQPVPRSPGHDL